MPGVGGCRGWRMAAPSGMGTAWRGEEKPGRQRLAEMLAQRLAGMPAQKLARMLLCPAGRGHFAPRRRAELPPGQEAEEQLDLAADTPQQP